MNSHKWASLTGGVIFPFQIKATVLGFDLGNINSRTKIPGVFLFKITPGFFQKGLEIYIYIMVVSQIL